MDRATDALQRLNKLLASDRYPVNSRLPAERQLSADLGLSRRALREGLAILEAEGRVWRHVGKGTFVGSRPLRQAQIPGVVSQHTSPAEILEVRILIEPRIASLAAIRAKADDIAHMQRCLDKLDGYLRRDVSADQGRIYDKWDGTLHQAVAEATQNALLIALYEVINSLRSLYVWERLQTAALTRKRWHLYGKQHRAFVEAIAGRDPAAAERHMRQHLETVHRNFSKTMRTPITA